ncbi:ABC transporter permease [Pseudolactococcus reticulitermitis]|uniref:Uncharacterized protein n=1 Tax=Pseudolactococcus reticulitermitis TaxID=2025039 RepID=A0A224X1Z8_9LACT|nr:ABC transporter permease [Lactococcus reticulitermitis]GAX48199.1 hypothetical protein RsY01_1814 [Lactococcus reticulitermitis]
MIRLMKADFYRLSRTIGVYITLLVVVGFGILNTIFEAVASVGIEVDGGSGLDLVWNLPYLMQNTVTSTPLLNYCFISIFVILIGYEFSLKTYKNSLTSGTSRMTFVLAKYVTELLVLILATFIFFMAVLMAGIVKYGLADVNLFSIFSDMFLFSLVMGLMVSVLFSLATLILILTQSSVIAAVFIVIYPLILQIIGLVSKWENIKYFDLFGFPQMIGLNQLTLSESLPYLLVGLIIILLSLVGSAFVIKHKEL